MINIKNIFIGWWRFLFQKPTEETKRRLQICKSCKYNKYGWCGICGCKLSAKAAVEDEKCDNDKW